MFQPFQHISTYLNQGVLYPGRPEPVALLVAPLLPTTGEAPEHAGRHLRCAGGGAGHGAGEVTMDVVTGDLW